MLIFVVAACLAVLLVSNIWLLREVESLRARVGACREELTLLDNQVCRLMVELQEGMGRRFEGSEIDPGPEREYGPTPRGSGPY